MADPVDLFTFIFWVFTLGGIGIACIIGCWRYLEDAFWEGEK